MKFPQFILTLWTLLLSGISYAQENNFVDINSSKQIDEMLFEARKTLITNPENTVTLSRNIYKFSTESDNAYGQDYSLLLLCYGYYFDHKYDSVIKIYPNLEKTIKSHANFEALADATLLKSKTLSLIKQYDQGVEEARKMPEIVKKIISKNSKFIYNGLHYENLAGLTLNGHLSRDTVFYYTLLAQKEFEKVNDPKGNRFIMHPKSDLQYYNYTYLANEFMAKTQYDSVEHYLNIAQKINPIYENNICEVLIYNNIACLFMLKKNYSEAIDNYFKSIEIAKKYNDSFSLATAYDGISVCFYNMKDYENATKYMSLLTELEQAITFSQEKVVASSIGGILKEKEGDYKKTNYNLYRIITISAILTLLCLFAIAIFYTKLKKNKLTKKQIEILLKDKMEQLSQVTEANNKKNVAIDIEEIISLAIKNDPSFYIKFQEAFPQFISRLLEIAPTMIATELKFAAYIKLDFLTKEIARYTNTSIRSVEAKKYRLRKKLNIPTDDDTNLWMSKV